MNEEITDEQIIKQVLLGDKNAFGGLINRFENKLSRYIRRFIYDENEAGDLLQNVFIKAYTNLNSFNFNYKFSPWIYRITHNEIVNYIKKKQKTKIVFDIDWDTIVPIKDNGNFGEEIDKDNLEKWLAKSLKEIPYKYKEVLTLYYFEGLAYKEISEVLLIPSSTVGIRIKRAKELLKKLYNKKP